MGVSEVRELRDLKGEKHKLKHMVTDLRLDKYILEEGWQKYLISVCKRALVRELREVYELSVCRACGLMNLECSTYYYTSCRGAVDVLLVRLKELVASRLRIEYWRMISDFR